MKDPKIKYNDYPLEQVAEEAFARVINNGGSVHQKWTCQHCHTRQTMEEKNTFFRTGKCEECGQVTSITKCNYLAIL